MEKFALLNLLNALSSLSPKPSAGQPGANDGTENGFSGATADGTAANGASAKPAANGAPTQNANNAAQNAGGNTYPNVMASVLERHEAISNRVKNKK